jgi:multidrug transporter EmrE-like cation transporter
MKSPAAISLQAPSRLAPAISNRPIYMVLGCTVFAAAAQVLMKLGAGHPMPAMIPANSATWAPFVLALAGNYPLLIGYSLHACNAMLLILALREGELSVLYPIISLTYVWVNLLSMYFFHEHMNFWKAFGIGLIVTGVALLGRASGQDSVTSAPGLDS